MAIKGIQDVYVNVADMARAIDFYRRVLGCQPTYSSEHWTSLDAYGLKLGLHWTGGPAVPVVPHDAHGPFVGATVTFQSDDIAADKQHLLAHGVVIVGETNADFGDVVVFRDSEGNLLKLMRQKY